MSFRTRFLATAVAILLAAVSNAALALGSDTPQPSPAPRAESPADAPLAETPMPDIRGSRELVRVVRGEGGYLGLGLTEIGPDLQHYFGAPEDQGILVNSVEKDSPAQKAGIRAGDVVLAVDGDPVHRAMQVARRISHHKKGDKAALEILRDKKILKLSVEVAERDGGVEYYSSELPYPPMAPRAPRPPMAPRGPLPPKVPEPPEDPCFFRTIDPEIADRLSRQIEEGLNRPELREKIQEFQRVGPEIEQKMRELQRRLEELERKLEERPKTPSPRPGA